MTFRLAEFLTSATFQDLPAPVVSEAKRAVLDWLGSAMAGSLEPSAQSVRRVVERLGTADDSTMFGWREAGAARSTEAGSTHSGASAARSSAACAALANGVSSHTLELDDVHKLSTLHAAAPVISAAFAVAEREHSSGQAFLLAVVLGYEAALRIGEAVNPSHYRFWHPTGSVATFGAAAAAGALLGLNTKQMVDALGTAGTQAAGLWEFNADGAMSKSLHPGKAAFNGVLAADLAREGFTGATRILEGERGFFRAMCENADASRITDRLGELWKITENCYKLHACCGHTHTAIDAAIDIRERQDVGEIERVRLETYGPGWEIVKERRPRTAVQARFSLAYCFAAGLVEGRVGIEQFSAERFGADGVRVREIADVMERTHIEVAPDLTAKYPAAWPVRLTVTYKNGAELHTAADFPKGNPENPISTTELENKFVGLVAPRFGDAEAARLAAWARSIERCKDVAEVFAPAEGRSR